MSIELLYPDTKKELFYSDYKPIQDRINSININDMPCIIKNLENAYDNAYCYHSDMLCSALYDDICSLKKWYIVRIVSCYSSGTIAGFIGSSKYINIDNAVNKTLRYLFSTDHENLFPLSVDMESIGSLVRNCYNDNTL